MPNPKPSPRKPRRRGKGAKIVKPMPVNVAIVWGAAQIGQVINRNPRQTHYLLEKGQIRSARKIKNKSDGRGIWCARVDTLLAEFDVAAKPETAA
jgi:hypothetical protein